MKKLLTIIASALTLGAFAGQENVPVAFDTSSVPVGTEVNVEANGEVFATALTTGRMLFASLPDGEVTSYGLKLAGEVKNTVIDTDFTTASALPVGWTAKRDGSISASSFTFNSNGAIANTAWGANTLITTCKIANGDTATIDVVTYSNNTDDYNMVLSLGSSNYSVALGNSYNNNNGRDGTAIKVGTIDGDSAEKFMCFQSGTGTNPANPVIVAEKDALNVKASLTYHLEISGGKLSGTVTDGETTKDIEFSLPETFGFTSFGIDLAGPGNGCGVKSVKIMTDRVSRTLYLDPACFGTEDRHPEIAALDWTSSANVKIVDAEGNEVTDRTEDDIIVIRDSVNLGIRPEITGLNLVIDNNATVGFPMAGSGMNYCLEGVDVEVKAGSKVKISRTWGSGWTKGGTDIFNIKNTSIHGAGIALVNSDVTVQLEGSSISLPIAGSGTVNAFSGISVAEAWIGTVVLGTVANGTNIGQYGKANSTVKFGGDFTGHLSSGCNIAGDLDLGGHTIKFSNGYTGNAYVINRLVGNGTINVTWSNKQTITINNVLADDGETISFTGTIEGNAEVTLPAGYELDAAGHIVKHVDAPTMPKVIEGGSDEQQTAYVTWAAAAGVADPTTVGAAEAFALNLTATAIASAGSVEQAVKDELDALLVTIDADENIDLIAIMQAIVAGESNGVISIDGYENATIKLVTTSLGEGVASDAKLFKLTVSFKSAKLISQ